MNLKSILLAASAATLVFASSCKKDDDNNGGGTNRFTVNGTTYTPTSVTRTSTGGLNAITAISTSGSTSNSVALYFDGALPTSSTTVRVGDEANQMGILASFNGNSYYNQEFTNVNATVTVNGGKLTIAVPEVWVVNFSGNDSVKFTANLIEN